MSSGCQHWQKGKPMIEVEQFQTCEQHLEKERLLSKEQRDQLREELKRTLENPSEIDLYVWGILNGAHGEKVAEGAHLLIEQKRINFAWLVQLACACYLDAAPSQTRYAWDKLEPEQRDEIREELQITADHWGAIGFVKLERSEDPPATSYGGALLHNYKAGLMQVECIYPDGLERVEDYVFYEGRWHNCHLLDRTRAGVRFTERKGFSPQKYAIECKQKNGAAND